MSPKTMDIREFSRAVRVTVPKRIQAKGRKVFLAVAARTHQELTIGTPVDTGYARASLAASTTGVPFPVPPIKPTGKGHTPKPRQFAVLWPSSQARAVSAIAVAVKNLTRLEFAYGASYARYEKTRIPALVRRVRAMVPSYVRDAVRSAQHLTSGEAAD